MALFFKTSKSLLLKNNIYSKAKVGSVMISGSSYSAEKLSNQSFFLKEHIQLRYSKEIQELERKLTKEQNKGKQMLNAWPTIIEDLSNTIMKDCPEVLSKFKEIVQYNILNRVKNSSHYQSLFHSYELMILPEQLTAENIRLAEILACCYDLVAAYLLMEDDMLDNSPLRGGQQSWYFKNNKDISTIKDGHLLSEVVYQLLKIHFRDKPCYVDMFETVQECLYRLALAQILDTYGRRTKTSGKSIDINEYSMEKWESRTFHLGYITFMSIKLAMLHAGITNPEVYRKATVIGREVIFFTQTLNDFADAYGDPAKTGKESSDIAEGKCTFLIVTALKYATPEQKNVLMENYACDDLEKIARVEQLYHELDIPSLVFAWQKENYDLICDHSHQLSDVLNPNVFLDLIRIDAGLA